MTQEATILIVDDSPEDRDTYLRFLSRDRIHSYAIHTVHYAREGIQFCERQWPDAIVLDFMLPDLNAIQFIETLQNLAGDRALPAIVVLTGQGNEEVAVTLMKKGVQDYLTKNGLTEIQFQSTIQRVLAQAQLKKSLAIQQQWQRLLAETSLRLRQSLKLTDILNTTTQEVKKFLRCDRTLVYQFDGDWMGTVVAEAVDYPWRASLGEAITDTCFQETKAKLYQEGRQRAIEDIDRAGLSECHIDLLKAFQVRSVLVVPILLNPDNPQDLPRLWGLLIAHQCGNTRAWTNSEALFLDQLAVQMAIAIQEAELLAQLQQELAQRERAERALILQAKEREQLIRRLETTTKLLEQRNEELDSFVSIASHDLRAPIRAIKNLTTWLAEDLETVIDADSQHQFKLLQSRIEQMEALLNDLLQYARVGRYESQTMAINVRDAIDRILQGLDLPPDFTVIIGAEMPTLATNAIALEQVFTNLITNAIKHHDRVDGRIEIVATSLDNFYRFAIVDDGPGISPEYHDRIFEIFSTLSTTNNPNSTGVGLAIVKKIVELQGGTIGLESEVGKGSTFYFTWQRSSAG